MDIKTTLSISEARKKIFEIAENVQKPSRYYTLTEKGRPKVVIMSAEEFESWQETLEVMQIFPDLEKDIKETKRDYRSGEYKKYATLEGIVAKENGVLKDKPKQKHGIRNKIKTASGKRSRKNSKAIQK